MNWIMLLSDIRDWVLYLATALGTLAIGHYWRVARWWEKPEGRFLFGWMLWAWFIMVFISVRISTWLNVAGGIYLGMFIYILFAVMAIWSIRIISGTQWENLKNKAIRSAVSRKESQHD